MKDERRVKKEGKTNFSRHLKQFDGVTWLTLTPNFTTDLSHWLKVTMAGLESGCVWVEHCDCYRATLCVNTVIAVAGCPSVCLSVCHICAFYPDGEDIVKLLCRSGNPIILVFWSPRAIPNSKGNSFSVDPKYKGWEFFAIFDWNLRLSRKRYEIGPWLLWNVNRKSYALYRMMAFSTTLTDH